MFYCTLLLSNFWTNRGHRCPLFSPPVLAFNFITNRVQQSHFSSISNRVLFLTHAVALSASQLGSQAKVPRRIYTSLSPGALELE